MDKQPSRSSKIPVPSFSSKSKALSSNQVQPSHPGLESKDASSGSEAEDDCEDAKAGSSAARSAKGTRVDPKKASASLKHLKKEHEEALALLKELGGELDGSGEGRPCAALST